MREDGRKVVEVDAGNYSNVSVSLERCIDELLVPFSSTPINVRPDLLMRNGGKVKGVTRTHHLHHSHHPTKSTTLAEHMCIHQTVSLFKCLRCPTGFSGAQ